jgi:hypothetical protein
MLRINNRCSRLVANAIIYYNSAILSRLLRKGEAEQNIKALDSSAHGPNGEDLVFVQVVLDSKYGDLSFGEESCSSQK